MSATKPIRGLMTIAKQPGQEKRLAPRSPRHMFC